MPCIQTAGSSIFCEFAGIQVKESVGLETEGGSCVSSQGTMFCLGDAHGHTLVHYDHSSRIMKVQLYADLNACFPTFRGDMFFRTRDDKGPKGS